MESQTSNERVSCFDAIRPTDEEEVPQDLNEEMEDDIIFYKEEEITHISCKNKSKGKRTNVQVQDQMGTIEYLDHNQKTLMHNVTNGIEELKGQWNKEKGKNKGQTSKPMRVALKTEHWVGMGNTKIKGESLPRIIEFAQQPSRKSKSI